VVRRRDAFERDPPGFTAQWRRRTTHPQAHRPARTPGSRDVGVPDAMLERAATLCMALGTDGLRGELTLMRAARALAALRATPRSATRHLRAWRPALRHRLRRNPLDDAGSTCAWSARWPELFGP
jgi:magnesium chelatase subunit I